MKMWICRDMDNTLWLSEGEPYLDEEKGEWNFRSGNYMNLSKEKYPEVTFENSHNDKDIYQKFEFLIREFGAEDFEAFLISQEKECCEEE